MASRHQLPVDFLDQLVHAIAEELMHFAEAALGVEGGVVEVVALEAEGIHDVIADELEEGGLGFGKFLLGGNAGVAAERSRASASHSARNCASMRSRATCSGFWFGLWDMEANFQYGLHQPATECDRLKAN